MKKTQKFNKFLESLKGTGHDSLIESVKNGFKVCFENETRTDHYITTTYETWDEESAEIGETDDRGWLDEEGQSMEPDKYDIEEGLNVIDITVKFLSDKGAMHPNNSSGGSRWWSTEEEMDMHTGDRTITSYHLNNYTAEEMEEVQEKMGK